MAFFQVLGFLRQDNNPAALTVSVLVNVATRIEYVNLFLFLPESSLLCFECVTAVSCWWKLAKS